LLLRRGSPPVEPRKRIGDEPYRAPWGGRLPSGLKVPV